MNELHDDTFENIDISFKSTTSSTHLRETNDLSMIERRKRTFNDSLISGAVNHDKNTQRKELLKQHPELKRRVDLNVCRSIIDFVDFRVSPRSSIARDQAIEGSDLDGGVVVIGKQVPINQQHQFIDELKRQGFTACHVTERDRLRAKYEELTDEQKIGTIGEEARTKILNTQHSVIYFAVESEANQAANQPKIPAGFDFLPVFLAGTSIESVYKQVRE